MEEPLPEPADPFGHGYPDFAPAPARRFRRSTRSTKMAVAALVILAVVLFGGPWLFFNVIEGKSPGKLHLPAATGVSSGPLAPGPVSGTWAVGTGSQAGYRVEEILLGQSHTAVGRTSKVSGGIVISGTTVTAADFTVDMASISSDQRSRDVQWNGYIMETYKYTNATFHLTEPIDLGSVPAEGAVISKQATGNLDMRGVTQPITFTLSAERTASGIDVNAEIPVTFSKWKIPNPSFAVAKVGNTGTLEVLLQLTKQS